MTYNAFEIRVFPILIIELILSVFGIFLTIKMLLKWKERKVPATLHLSIVIIFLTLGIFTLAVGLLEAAITGYYKEIYRLSLPLAMSFVVVSNIFLFIFASKITKMGEKALIPLIIIGIIIIGVIFLPWNWWGHPREDYEGKLNIRLYSTLALVVYCYFTYITIIIICRRTKKISHEKITHAGLSLLSYSMMAMICYWICLIADTALITFAGHPGYSIFIYIAWIFATIFCILIYSSLIMPKWLANWIEKKNK